MLETETYASIIDNKIHLYALCFRHIFYLAIRMQENLTLNISCGVQCTFLGMKMSDEPNQDILGIETNYTMSGDNMGEWTEKVGHA